MSWQDYSNGEGVKPTVPMVSDPVWRITCGQCTYIAGQFKADQMEESGSTVLSGDFLRVVETCTDDHVAGHYYVKMLEYRMVVSDFHVTAASEAQRVAFLEFLEYAKALDSIDMFMRKSAGILRGSIHAYVADVVRQHPDLAIVVKQKLITEVDALVKSWASGK